MSIGPMGALAGSAAGSPLAQTVGTETERAQQEVSGQQRRMDAEKKAEAAAGIGQTDGEDHETADRDADGRRMWENAPEGKGDANDRAEDEGPKSKDASGKSGTQLDLSG
jgi:hypothetical protein